MHRIRTILVATVLATGIAGAAMATERTDGSWYPGDNDRGGVYHRGNDYGHGSDYGRYGSRGRDGIREGSRRYGARHGAGYGRVTPMERMRIRQARMHLRLLERRAMRDGIVTRWERVRIHQARQRLAWLTMRMTHNGW